jgi:2-oxoacid:acceptor oxidoreductase delta subunit (pyruvate/2-ketoisovalerate family)
MAELTDWRALPIAGAVSPADAPRPATGAWRTGLKPAVALDRCVDCLLCWLYCPDSAVLLDGTAFAGFDYTFCKGCEICADRCPTTAITMVAEETPVSELGEQS